MTNQVKAGRVYIGGGAPVSVQSMLSVPYTDVEGNVREARRLAAAAARYCVSRCRARRLCALSMS